MARKNSYRMGLLTDMKNASKIAETRWIRSLLRQGASVSRKKLTYWPITEKSHFLVKTSPTLFEDNQCYIQKPKANELEPLIKKTFRFRGDIVG